MSRCLILLSCLLALPAAAEKPADGDLRWGLGTVVISRGGEYAGADADTRVFPAVFLRYRRFSFNGLTARYDLVQGRPVTAGLQLQGRFDGYEPEDSPFLTGMAERKPAAYAGGFTRIFTPLGLFTAELQSDISDVHDGWIGALEYRYPLPLGDRLRLEPFVGAEYHSERLVNYYYGVRPEEALVGRPAYEPGAAVERRLGVTLRLMRQGSPHGLFVSGVRTDFDDVVTDSPLVGTSSVFRWLLGYAYSF